MLVHDSQLLNTPEFCEPLVKPPLLEIGHGGSIYTLGIGKHYKSESWLSRAPLPLGQNKHFLFQSNE